MAGNFQQLLIREVREYFRPLLDSGGDPETIFAFLETIGWHVRPALASETALTGAFDSLATLIATFSGTADADIDSLQDLRLAFDRIVGVVQGVEAFRHQLDTLANLNPGDLLGDILNALSILYIQRRRPLAYALLRLLTLIRVDEPQVLKQVDAVRFRNQFPQLRLDRIGPLLADPQALLAAEYWPVPIAGRAEAIAVADKFFPRVLDLFAQISEDSPVKAAFGRGGGPNTLPQPDEDRLSAMLSFWWDAPEPGLDVRIGASIGIVPISDSATGPGVAVVPFGDLSYERTIGGWHAAFSAAYDAAGFEITRAGVDAYAAGGAVPRFSLMLAPEVGSDPGLLIGSKTGTRFEIQHYWVEFDAILTKPDHEISVYLRLREGALVVGGGDGDGFLKKILPEDGLRVDFDLGLGWSNLRGFHIEGSGSLEFRVPLHLSLGPVEIPGLTIRAGFQDDKLPISIGCDVTAKLGPLTAVVQNMGVRLDFSFPPGGGNLGPLNWDPKFKPPSGIGLSIDGGGFKGGGFISFEPELDRYAGLLELEFSSGFALKAIGLLNTKLPGDVPGYSLLIIISAEFSPIQLSFGFTLNGVGGLLGLNRTTNITALRDGVKTGALNHILFPKDIVENAAQIISDLREIFPPAADRFIFGPMAKIGWGTPTLVEIELGLMVEGMSPWRIMLPGVVRLVLPSRDNAILKLQVNFLGTWEQDKKTITFYASLFDSSLLSMPLTGDMAFLMKYGENPNFLITAGGWHPSFKPPPLPFPAFSRMSLIIRNDSNLRIVLSSYFAVTSNTAQIGCSVDLRASQGKYSVEGYLGFDALFHFSPFSMTVDIAATLTLRRNSKVMFGVQVYANLSGPTPWSARGTATFTILKQDISFEFSHVWGEHRNTIVAATDVFEELKKAIENPGNWEAITPEGIQNLVTLRQPGPAEATLLLLSPDGTLAVRQKVVPLDVGISMFGNCAPKKDRKFSIKRFLLAGQPVTGESLRDEFAPAQFQSLSDADKLSRNSFETMPAGARMSGAALKPRSGGAWLREVGYEVKIVDSRTNVLYVGTKSAHSAQSFQALLNGNSTSRFVDSAFSARQRHGSGLAIAAAAQESFAIVSTANLKKIATNATFASQTEALDHFSNLLAGDPSLRGEIQIVPNYEARAA